MSPPVLLTSHAKVFHVAPPLSVVKVGGGLPVIAPWRPTSTETGPNTSGGKFPCPTSNRSSYRPASRWICCVMAGNTSLWNWPLRSRYCFPSEARGTGLPLSFSYHTEGFLSAPPPMVQFSRHGPFV